MSRLFCAGLLVGACCFATQNAGGQQLLDRVLDRVQDELDNRSKPAPGDDQPELGPGGPEEIEGGGGSEPAVEAVRRDAADAEDGRPDDRRSHPGPAEEEEEESVQPDEVRRDKREVRGV